MNFDAPDARFVTQSKVDARIAGRAVTGIGMNPAHQGREIVAVQKHFGAVRVAAFLIESPHRNPARYPKLIAKQLSRAAVLSDDDIGVTVIVDVAECRPSADSALAEQNTRFVGDIPEHAATQIADQFVLLAVRT